MVETVKNILIKNNSKKSLLRTKSTFKNKLYDGEFAHNTILGINNAGNVIFSFKKPP
jgi:aspartate/glutamate racemase